MLDASQTLVSLFSFSFIYTLLMYFYLDTIHATVSHGLTPYLSVRDFEGAAQLEKEQKELCRKQEERYERRVKPWNSSV